MPLINAQINNDNAVRGKEVKKITYAAELWAEAQQKDSKTQVYTTKKSLDGGSYRLFARTKKRDFKERRGSVQRTNYTGQEFSRRALFAKTYDDAIVADLEDLISNQVDILEAAKAETRKAGGRLMDTVILDSLIASHHSEIAGSTEDTLNRLTAALNIERRFKDVVWAKTSGLAADAALTKFVADDLEDIKAVFAKRDVMESIKCTLTPEMKRLLMKDPDFKDAENTFSITKAEAAGMKGFMYKEIEFIQISESVLPLLSKQNIGIAANSADAADDTHYTSKQIAARDLSSTARVDASDTLTAVQEKDSEHAIVECNSANMAYFWVPEAVYFTSRPELTKVLEADLPDFRHARSCYFMVNFGALTIDDNWVMAVPINGTLKEVAA